MKVLHIITGLNNGGAESVLYRLSVASHPKNHHVISMMGAGKYGPLLEEAGVKVTCLNMPAGRVSFSGLWRLYCLLRNEKPSVVQTWMYHADLIGGVIARLAGIRNVCWNIRHSELEAGKSKRTTIWVAKACTLLSKWVPRKIICCAEKARQVHIEYGYDTTKMVVIGNGYNLELFKPDQVAGMVVRKELGISNTDILLGMVGRFNVQKNHKGLLNALNLLRDKGIDFKCALVGTGMNSANPTLVDWIADNDLQNEILLLGQRTDIPAIMNALDTHVLSSSSEGFPNVLAEAMACGTPCVTTNAGDAAQIVVDTGWVVPVSDDRALAEALLEAVGEWKDQPELWERRSLAAVDRVAESYSLKKMVESYHSVWNVES